MAKRAFVERSLTPFNLHVTAAILFLLLDAVLAGRLLLAWHRTGSDQNAEYASELVTYAQLQAHAAQLQHLPAALNHSAAEGTRFLGNRLEPSDSAVLSELGALTEKDHVRLSRASYTLRPAVAAVTEMRVEANFAGPYTDLMHFINDVERDKDHAFFIIRSVVLSGQQGGQVELRLRMDTYMRSTGVTAVTDQAIGAGAGQETQ